MNLEGEEECVALWETQFIKYNIIQPKGRCSNEGNPELLSVSLGADYPQSDRKDLWAIAIWRDFRNHIRRIETGSVCMEPIAITRNHLNCTNDEYVYTSVASTSFCRLLCFITCDTSFQRWPLRSYTQRQVQ